MHYPKAYEILEAHERFNNDVAFREKILAYIIGKIEKRFGRQEPVICTNSGYSYKWIREHLTRKERFTKKDWPEEAQVLCEALNENEYVENNSSDDESFDHQTFRSSRDQRYDLVDTFSKNSFCF